MLPAFLSLLAESVGMQILLLSVDTVGSTNSETISGYNRSTLLAQRAQKMPDSCKIVHYENHMYNSFSVMI